MENMRVQIAKLLPGYRHLISRDKGIYAAICRVFNPNGERIGEVMVEYGETFTEADLIAAAWGEVFDLPAWDESIDAAWSLPLKENCGWNIHGPIRGVAGQVTIKNFQTMQTYSALFHDDVARALAEAWLAHMGVTVGNESD